MTQPAGRRPTTDDLRQLWLDHSRSLVLYARQWCRAPEDVVQEVFIELSRVRELPREPAAWLFSAVRRRAINWHRGEERRRKNQRQAAEQRGGWFVDDSENSLDHAALQVALEALPAQQREIVIARIWGGQTYEQIATLVGSSKSSIHREYERALRRLEELLQTGTQKGHCHGSAKPRESTTKP